MEFKVVYRDSEPVEVRFPYNIKVQLEGSTAVIDRGGDSMYVMLSEKAKKQLQDELWKLEFIEGVKVIGELEE